MTKGCPGPAGGRALQRTAQAKPRLGASFGTSRSEGGGCWNLLCKREREMPVLTGGCFGNSGIMGTGPLPAAKHRSAVLLCVGKLQQVAGESEKEGRL